MSRLFRRNVRLTVARPAGDGPSGYFTQQANAVQIEKHRVVFEVEKTLHGAPNTTSVEVYNLAERTRAAFEESPLFCILEAGHDGEYAVLAAGDLRRARSEYDGTNWVTRLELGEGRRAYLHARVSRSLGPGTEKLTAVRELAAAMGLVVPAGAAQAVELKERFQRGIALHGRASEQLDRIAAGAGFQWSVQDGVLVMLRAGDVRPGEAFVVSQDTGMIGSPVHGSPPTAGGPAPVLVRMLLAAQVRAGGVIQVESIAHRGQFRVEKVRHAGDTEGPDWTTEVEAKPR